jgi:hypothetical protein
VRDKAITLTGQLRNTIRTSYVSILRLSSFYLYKLQTIWLLHLYYIVSAIQMFVYLSIQHSLTSICYTLNFLYRWILSVLRSLWRPCLSTDRDEMSNLYRRPSIVASYQVSVFIVSSFSEIMCTDFVCLYTYEFWPTLWKIFLFNFVITHIHLT